MRATVTSVTNVNKLPTSNVSAVSYRPLQRVRRPFSANHWLFWGRRLTARPEGNGARIAAKMRILRVVALILAIAAVSFLHYETLTTHVWLHQIFERAYYIPILLAALWYGWRGGLSAATLSGLMYLPHILMAWSSHPEHQADQLGEILMFFAIGALTGVLSDDERAQRRTVEETARKLSEVNSQLQKSFEQLRRADRLSALGELSAGLAHEIRNPLGSIEGAVKILGRRELAEDTRKEFTELASHEVDRLKGLLTNFLEFARPQPPRRSASEVNLLLHSVVKLASETATMSGVRFRAEGSGELPAVSIDQEQIKQVLLNLVLNAVQAMPGGGEISLRAAQDTDFVRIDVVDEGTGIPPEDMERIFDPFFTTRSTGTGLGLSIAYQIVHQHGGHITAKPNAGRGMTFAVTLPVASRADQPVALGR